jgi:uncharacterized membrane protein
VPSDSVQQAIDDYLARLRKGLRRLPGPERDELVEELRGHVLERLEARGSSGERSLDEVLRAVGDPAQLASQCETEALLRRAATSRSPWLLLRTTARWAGRGVAGVVALLVTVSGYGSALVCYACAVAKPLFPSHIGMWLTPEHGVTIGYWSGRLPSDLIGLSVGPPGGLVVFGTFGPTAGPLRELLGLWLTPAGILAGFFFALATTWCARWLMRRQVTHRVTLSAVPTPS